MLHYFYNNKNEALYFNTPQTQKNQKPKTKQKTTAAVEAAQGIILPVPLSNLNHRMSPKTEIPPNLKSNKI